MTKLQLTNKVSHFSNQIDNTVLITMLNEEKTLKKINKKYGLKANLIEDVRLGQTKINGKLQNFGFKDMLKTLTTTQLEELLNTIK